MQAPTPLLAALALLAAPLLAPAAGLPAHGFPAGYKPGWTGRPATPVYHSPQAVHLSPDGLTAAVTNATADTVSLLDVRGRQVIAEIAVGRRPNQAVFSPDGRRLYVSCSWSSRVDEIDVAARRVIRALPCGLEPNGLVVSPDGGRLYVVNCISDDVSIVDLAKGLQIAAVKVGRQPRFATLTPDGRRLLVTNNLGRSLSVVDLASAREIEQRDMGKASMLREVVCTRDGRYAIFACLVSHEEAPTVQIERGWIHSNGFTIADLTQPGHRVTMLLDHLLSGAANPTSVALSADEQFLYVSLAGIHEVAIVDLPRALHLAAQTVTPEDVRRLQENVEILAERGIARRVPCGGINPRSLALDEATGELLVANYFTEDVTVLDPRSGELKGKIQVAAPQEMSLWRQGEMLSCDARMCYQNWFSCVSCHLEDGSSDGLNWDLANDGLGNPKNAKDLTNGFDTAPAMWGGVRADLDDGIAGGQRFEGFVANPERQKALLAYFGNPEHAPNPWRGRDPAAEARGKALFTAASCDLCHPGPKYTDQKLHDLGFGARDDYRSRFDTPSLRNTYRLGPWLHDGRAPTLQSLFTEHNPKDVHGRTRGLTPQEIDDLVAYIRTL